SRSAWAADLTPLAIGIDGAAVEHAIGPLRVVALAVAHRPGVGLGIAAEHGEDGKPDDHGGDERGENEDPGDAAVELALAIVERTLRLGHDIGVEAHRFAPDPRRARRGIQ